MKWLNHSNCGVSDAVYTNLWMVPEMLQTTCSYCMIMVFCGMAFLSFWLTTRGLRRCCMPTRKGWFASLWNIDRCLLSSSKLRHFCTPYLSDMSSLSATSPSLWVAAAAAAAVSADVAEVFSRGTDLISPDPTLLHAGSCHTISHVGEDNPSLAASTQTMW